MFTMPSSRLISILSILALLLCGCSRLEPSIACAGKLNVPDSIRVLVIGESWATHGKELPELPNAISARTAKSARVCTIGYSGANSRKLLYSFRRDFSPDKVRSLLGGNADEVVFLTGVNDIVQHVGASAYARNTSILVAESLKFSRHVQVMQIPSVDRNPRRPLLSSIKARVFRRINDRDEIDSLNSYRGALADLYPGVNLIKYDAFSLGFANDSSKYMPDGIHLTQYWFHQYGTYIGKNMVLSSERSSVAR